MILHPVGCATRCTSREVALDRFRHVSGACDSSRTAPANLTSEVIGVTSGNDLLTFTTAVKGDRLHGVLTTMMADGQPHSSLVWCDYGGVCARINTTRQREKSRNMLANPKVSLLVVDPQNTARYLEIRGEAELTEAGALDHLDRLTRHYTHHPHYYGSISPAEQQAQETSIICRIHATKITWMPFTHNAALLSRSPGWDAECERSVSRKTTFVMPS